MDFFDLGLLPGQGSMTIFHALAYLGREAVVVVSPRDPLVSIGFFQDAEAGLDVGYCRKEGIGVMRREIGGGTTYLDSNQVFYQVILDREHPLVSGSISAIYERLSEVPIRTYRRLGVPARFRPVNDIVTLKGRKIAGEGGGDIGPCRVFVGGILLDFDYRRMSRVLKVPDEKFRDKVFKSMEENLTTIREETGAKPDREEVVGVLREEFSKSMGELVSSEITPGIEDAMRRVEKKLTSDGFVFRRSSHRDPTVRVSSSAGVLRRQHKAAGGLVMTVFALVDNKIHDLSITGDFTLLPAGSLEEMESRLEGIEYEASEVEGCLSGAWSDLSMDFPGVTISDIVSALGL